MAVKAGPTTCRPYDIDKGLGDLGNIVADENGTAEVSSVKTCRFIGDRNIIGRAIVVYVDEDDLGKGGDGKS